MDIHTHHTIAMSDTILVASDGEVHIPEGIYPLNGDPQSFFSKLTNGGGTIDQALDHRNINDEHAEIYPDFKIWKQEKVDDAIMQTCLQKGYSMSEYVKHEDQSGRHLFADILDKSKVSQSPTTAQKTNKINIMGQMFVDAMHKRRLFNVIRSKGAYKPPPRVTLTEHKKEAWLKKLSNPEVPLKDLSRAIPHGLRNKLLFEQCLLHKVPISRALWLIKCIATNEQRQLKRKTGTSSAVSASVSKWIAEWTEQITAFFESIIESCFDTSVPKETWRFRLDYTISLVTNLYSEDLMNRITYLTWIVRYTTHIVNNATSFEDLKTILAHQLIIKLFWFKIIKFDYLTKELSESMLLLLVKANQLSRKTKFEALATKINTIFQELIKYLFYFNSDIFILPGKWNTLKPYLRKVLDMDLAPVNDQFKLIAYRNESLTNDEFDRPPSTATSTMGTSFSQGTCSTIPSAAACDGVSMILYKLNNPKGESISTLSRLVFEESNSDTSSGWKNFLHIFFQWSIRSVQDPRMNLQKITLVCSILQFRISYLIQVKSQRYKQFRGDLENAITDFIYLMSEVLNYHNRCNPEGKSYDINSFLILVNRLSAIKLFSVSSYLRRLIASGVIYLSEPDRTCFIHILILNSLPATNDSNLRSILKRLMDSTSFYIEKIDTNPIKLTMSNHLNLILHGKDVHFDLFSTTIDWQNNLFYNNPQQIGKHVELGEFLYAAFDTVVKNSEEQIILSQVKLISLYQLFEVHPVGLAKFLLSILDLMSAENSKLRIEDNDTFVLLLKMIIFHSKLLKSSIYDMKSSVWDSCVGHMMKVKESKSHNFAECLFKADIPSKIMQEFQEAKIIDGVLKSSPEFLTSEECQILDVSSYERLSNAAEFFHFASVNLTRYSNIVRNGDETFSSGLILKYLRSLQYWKPEEFSKCINEFLVGSVKANLQLDYEMCLKLLKRFVIDDLADLRKIMKISESKTETSDLFETNVDTLTLFWDLLFSEGNTFGFSFTDIFSYKYAIFIYEENHAEEYYMILSKVCFSSFYSKIEAHSQNVDIGNVSNTPSIAVDVSVNPVDVGVDVRSSVDPTVDVDVLNTFHDLNNNSGLEPPRGVSHSLVARSQIINGTVVSAVWDLVSCHVELFIENFYSPSKKSNMIDFVKLQEFVFKDLLQDETGNDDMIDVKDIVDRLNYFNLPILQWVFTLYVRKVFEEDELMASEPYLILIEKILEAADMNTSHYKLVGELFLHLSDELKVKMLSVCEEIYLNNDSFPSVMVDGNDVTKLLSCIMSSCLRTELFLSQNDGDQMGQLSADKNVKDSSISNIGPDECGEQSKKRGVMLVMSDALVFSLNSALEKLIYMFNNMEHSKTKTTNKLYISRALEFGIKMIARIILLHKYFLVELILERSVSLQRDVLIMNLMKLFNHRVMNKNPKLKNLLYDVLISIKVIISESITEKFQRSQSNQPSSTPGTFRLISPKVDSDITIMPPTNSQMPTNTNVNMNLATTPLNLGSTSMVTVNSPSMWITKSTPTNMTFSPTQSPKPTGTGVTGLSFLGESNNMLPSNSNTFILPATEDLRNKNGKGKAKSAKMSTGANNGRGGSSGSGNLNGGYLIMPNILNVKPPNYNNNLKSLLTMFDLKDTVPETNHAFYTVNQSWNGKVAENEPLVGYNLKPFELIEDSCPKHASNDCAINTALFGMSAKRENIR